MMRFFSVLFLLIWTIGSVIGVGFASTDPVPRVKSILKQAIAIQYDPDLQGADHRREKAGAIRHLISEFFLEEDMAITSLGPYWQGASAGQRREFQELFTILFQDSYTRLVLDFMKKENVEYLATQNEKTGVLVRTVIRRPNEHIPVDYSLTLKSGEWFIRDVSIDGVSIVANYQNAFRRVIAEQSLDALIARMRLQKKAIQEG
jgi:phospholipid transport system substrate-binding protein